MKINKWSYYRWVVSLLPKKLIYFCALRVWLYATSGEYEKTTIPEITMNDAMARFAMDNNIL